MRKSSAALTFVVAVSALSVAWRSADIDAAAINAPLVLEGLPTQTSSAAPVDPGETAAPSETATPTETANPGETAAPGESVAPTKSPTATPTPTAAAPVEITKSSDTITYQYGSIAMSVTVLDGSIVSASVTKGTTDFNGKLFAQWSKALVSGGGYANTTGATYSFEAFKAAATNVMGKF